MNKFIILPYDRYVHYGLNNGVKNQSIEDRRPTSTDTMLIKAQSGFGRQSDKQLQVSPRKKPIKRRRERQLHYKPLSTGQRVSGKRLDNYRPVPKDDPAPPPRPPAVPNRQWITY